MNIYKISKQLLLVSAVSVTFFSQAMAGQKRPLDNGHESPQVTKTQKVALTAEQQKSLDGKLLQACKTFNFNDAIKSDIEGLLEKGARVNFANDNGTTPLGMACFCCNEALAKMLLDKGADANVVDDKGADVKVVDDRCGNTLLLLACRNNNEALAKLRLDKGADVNVADRGGKTPLLLACENNNEALVKLLLEKGAEVNLADCAGETPLSVAKDRNYQAVVELLEKYKVQESLDRELLEACENNNEALVKQLLEKGARVNACSKYGNAPLYAACKNNYVALVRLLIKKGADVNFANYLGKTPLLVACNNNYVALVKLLLEKGARVNACSKYGNALLLEACKNNYVALVKLLLEKDADVNFANYWGHRPLLEACKNNNVALVKLLLEKGAEVNVIDCEWNTPLLLACFKSNEALGTLPLEKGADVNLTNYLGKTLNQLLPISPVCLIASFLPAPGVAVASTLALYGGINYAINYYKNKQQEECNKELKPPVVNPILPVAPSNNIDCNTLSGLSFACEKDDLALVKFLLEKGADVNFANYLGNTPLGIAKEKGNQPLVKLLEEYNS